LILKSWRAYISLSSDGKEARRRVWRVVGIGVVLLRHDGEVEGVVVKDDAVLELCVRGSPPATKMTTCHHPAIFPTPTLTELAHLESLEDHPTSRPSETNPSISPYLN
jgi:hypothetical protein